MRVLEINKFNYSRRGADTHFLDVVSLLEESGHRVAVFSMRHPENVPGKWDGYFVSHVGYNSYDATWKEKIGGVFRMFYSLEAKRKINRLLDDFRPDVVHIHNIYHQLSPFILFEVKKRGIPIVMTVHDYKLINPNHGLTLNGKLYGRCHGGKYWQCLVDKCVKNSFSKSFVAMLEAYWHDYWGTYRKNVDLYIAPSRFVKKTLVEWGIDGEKIVVLPHFVKEPDFSGFSRPAVRPYAVYFGSVSERKGVDKLVKIFKEIKNLELHLAGILEDGYEVPDIPNVKYLGRLDRKELFRHVSGADFVVSPSRLPETFGLAAAETNMCGKPFVGFRTGALEEIVENGVTGFLAESDGEFSKIIRQFSENKIQLDREGIIRKTKERFSPDKYRRQFFEIMESLVNAPPTTGGGKDEKRKR